MSDESNVPDRPLIGFITSDHAPPIRPAPINRTWMSEMRGGWANRCLPLLIANQGGWELRNPSAFSATWMGGDDPADLMVVPDTRDAGQFLPASNFGYGILTWHLPMLFRTRPATICWSEGQRTVRKMPFQRSRAPSKPTGRARVSA